MPRMVVSIDGVVIKEVPLTKERTTIGRRPYNDVVIDHLAVSGEHAVIVLSGDGTAQVEDMDSTNGTFVNGAAIKRQPLHNGDTVEVGKYKLRYLADQAMPEYEKTVFLKPGMTPPTLPLQPASSGVSSAAQSDLRAFVRVTSGPAIGPSAIMDMC